ncbi:MAG: hypothetical protein VW297_02760, partial [Paracoccaceae bacterium]
RMTLVLSLMNPLERFNRAIMDNALSMHFLQSQNQKTSQLSILGTRWLPLWELSGKAMTAPLMPFWLVTKPP